MASTSKNVLPSGGNLYVKNGSTAFKVAGSTGNLFHQAVVLPNTTLITPLASVTWPSTVAQTLANTSDSQTFYGKSLGSSCAWAVTTPTSASAATLALAPYGLNVIGRTSDLGTQAYTLSLSGSVVGAPVWIYASMANSSETITVATSKVNLINASSNGGLQTITFATAGTMVKLMTVSTTLGWALESLGSTLYSTCSGASTTLPVITS